MKRTGFCQLYKLWFPIPPMQAVESAQQFSFLQTNGQQFATSEHHNEIHANIIASIL